MRSHIESMTYCDDNVLEHCVACIALARLLWTAVISCASGLIRVIAEVASASFDSNDVDIYNSITGTWSTARLSVARRSMAATSVGNMAIFAGGYNPNSGTWK